MYKKYSKIYQKRAKLGITLKVYMLSVLNFSIYCKLIGSKVFICKEVTSFFEKKQIDTWLLFKDIPRNYIFNYICASFLLKDTQIKNYFLGVPIPKYIDEKEILIFVGTPSNQLLRDFMENKHYENFDYYIDLVKIINSKKTPLSIADIYYLLCFCVVFSKEKLFNLMSNTEFLYHYNNLTKINLKVLMLLIGEKVFEDMEKTLKKVLNHFNKLSFDGQFITLALLHKYNY